LEHLFLDFSKLVNFNGTFFASLNKSFAAITKLKSFILYAQGLIGSITNDDLL